MNNVLILTQDGIEDLKQEMNQKGRAIQIWSGLLICLLIFGCFFFVFGGILQTLFSSWRQGTTEEAGSVLLSLLIFVVLSVLAGALAGLFFGRFSHYGTLATVLSNKSINLRVVPGHFDGAAGLKPIGDFYLYQALVMAIPIFWLGIWWAWVIPTYGQTICSVTGRPHWMFVDWQWPFLIQWLVVLAYFHFGFIRPFMHLRNRIRDTRESMRLSDVDRLEQRLGELQSKWQNQSGDGSSEKPDEADSIARRLWQIRNMSSWPMDMRTLGRFRSLLVGEILLPVGMQVISAAQGGNTLFGISQMDWIGTFFGSIL